MKQFCVYCMNDTECIPTKEEVVIEYDGTPLRFEKKGYICSKCKNFIEGDMYDYNVVCGNNVIKTKVIKDQQEEIEKLNNIIKLQDTRNSRQRIANRKLLERNQDLVIENLKLNNIINDLLDRQNKALRYIGNHLSLDSRYKHGNGDEELILVRKILNKHIKELKGSDKE